MTLHKLIIASHNQGKIDEIDQLLQPFAVQVVSGKTSNLAEPEETEDSFKGNALLKARYFYDHTGESSLADDSGLVIPALDDAPGIYSARWAEQTDGTRDFNKAMQRVQRELAAKKLADKATKAHFACALALIHENQEIVVEGQVHGTLTFPPAGDNGFGYDPIFTPNGYNQTFAQLDSKIKQSISHRADAFEQLINVLQQENILTP